MNKLSFTILLTVVINIFFSGCVSKTKDRQTNIIWDSKPIPWQSNQIKNYNDQISSISISTNGSVFAGSGFLMSEMGFVFCFKDNGLTWKEVLLIGFVLFFVINLMGHIFLGTHIGVCMSKDNGESWTPLIYDKLNGKIIDVYFAALKGEIIQALAINKKGHIFAGSRGNGIFVSIDEGDNWKQVLPKGQVTVLKINNKGYVFAGVDNKIFVSIDNGNNWMDCSQGLPHDITSGISSLAFNFKGHIFIGLTYFGVFKSIDNGKNWISVGLKEKNIHTLLINSLDYVFVGCNYGVYLSVDNGEKWIQVNTGLTSHFDRINFNVYSLAIDLNGYMYAGTNGFGIFRTIHSTTSEK